MFQKFIILHGNKTCKLGEKNTLFTANYSRNVPNHPEKQPM